MPSVPRPISPDRCSTDAGRDATHRETWERWKVSVRRFLTSPAGRRGLGWFALLVAFLIAINSLNVLNSYVGRDFISAIEHRNMGQFTIQAWLYVGVLGLSTGVAVMYRFAEERLALLWRNWQTRHLLAAYLDRRIYYRLEESGRLENPDQRIAEDVRTFTATTLSFLLMMLNASFTIVAFSGVLWSISPTLFLAALAYAALGTVVTVLLGRRLVGLNHRQLDKEANFRSELMQVRENAEAVALLHREDRLQSRLLRRLDELVANSRRMIAVNRNLGFFTTGYNYFIQIMPALVVAPFFIAGQVEFGVVTQSAMGFAQLMGAFSLIVTQFQSISSYAAVIGRLGRLLDAVQSDGDGAHLGIDLREENDHLIYDRLTLRRPDGTVLIKELSLTVERGTRVLLAGSSGHAKIALFKATSGLCCDGDGTIIRPPANALHFLPERPYLPTGTLRELLLQTSADDRVTDDDILAILRRVQIESVVTQAGGLDAEHDWSNRLTLNEQALLAVARVLLAAPAFVFLDRLSIALDASQADRVLNLLDEDAITYLLLGKPDDHSDRFDIVLTLALDGSWTVTPRAGTPTAPG